jgi:hypothetical protein
VLGFLFCFEQVFLTSEIHVGLLYIRNLYKYVYELLLAKKGNMKANY